MASPPIPGALQTMMQAGHQAVRWRAVLGLTVQFRAYCCDINSDGIMGVSKQPVPVLDLDPNPLCLGDTLNWDLSNSYAPGSTITSYAIDMGDGTSYFVQSGTHTYAATGTYTVVATVAEGGGKDQSIEVQVEVIDCDEGLLASFAYAALYGDGVWFYDFPTATWTQRSGGLSGNALYVNSIALRPGDKRLPDTIHELYAATNGGLFFTYNGGRAWAKINLPDPSNDQDDASPPTADDLNFIKVVYSREDSDMAWVLAYKTSPDRMYVYRTDDYGFTWTSRGLIV